MNESLVKELLHNCADIIAVDRAKEVREGSPYNLLELMMDGDEEKVHSSIIASFLNPRGKHRQGSLFLKLFFEECGLSKDFDYDSAYVICEKDIGRKIDDGDNSSGGRIDIFIADKYKRKIILENKWNAGDQPYQLIRYHNYSPESKIIYLTRLGHLPSRYSAGESLQNGHDYICISYRENIIRWLDACIIAVEDKPNLIVALNSYRKLISRLNMAGDNSKILEQITESKDSIHAAFQISKAINSLKKKGQLFFWNELFRKIAEVGNFIPEVCSQNEGISDNPAALIPAINQYIDKNASMEKYRLYGIRTKIGTYADVDVYAAILVNTNIYFPVYAPGNANFNRQASEFFKDSGWTVRGNENIAWKRPGQDEKFNFRTFSDESVYTLALEDMTLVNHIYDEFLEAVRIAKHNLEAFETEHKAKDAGK